LPDRTISAVFRGTFIQLLKRAWRKGKLPSIQDRESLESLCTKSAKSDWVVKTKPPWSGPDAVLKYLARYTHRIAISNRRLIALKDGMVTFTYRDYRDNG